eukprot:6149642-Amphidinium_carterae.2
MEYIAGVFLDLSVHSWDSHGRSFSYGSDTLHSGQCSRHFVLEPQSAEWAADWAHRGSYFDTPP